MVRSKTVGERIMDGVIVAILCLVTLLCVAPILNTLALSLSSAPAAATGTVTFWPKDFSLYSYQTLLGDHKFFNAFWISIQRVVLGGGLNFILTILMAYPLSKETSAFRSRNIYMWLLVFAMLFNGGMIPWYMVVRATGIIDTIWALVLPVAVPIFNVILLMNCFRSVPKAIEEAGTLDGAGPWTMLFRIYLPISIPALATITLFSIVNHWNTFFDGMMLINSPDKFPLQTYIQQLVVDVTKKSMMSIEEIKRLSSISNTTLNAAKIFVSIIPILLVYPILQRYFITGIVMGSVKE